MTKKSLDGSISMVMSSGSPRISRYFPLLLAQELNYLPCKCLRLFFSVYIICRAEIVPSSYFFLTCRCLTNFSVAPLQHNLYIPACSCWSILPLQPRCIVYCIGCHLCTDFRNCWIHCYLFLLSAGGDKLGLYCLDCMNQIQIHFCYSSNFAIIWIFSGEESAVDRMPLLWTSLPDILLLEHSCYCL